MGSGFLAYRADQKAVEAQRPTRIAQARELAAASLHDSGIDPERSILLAMQAMSTTYTADHGWVMPESEDALRQAVRASHVRLTLTGHTVAVVSVAFSPDGVRLASANEDGMLRLYPAIIEELMALAGSRLTRSWNLDECQADLHLDSCPLSP